MKKLALVLMILSVVLAMALPTFAATSLQIDFEKPEIVVFKSISFEAAFDGKMSIEPQDGFSGNAYKAAVLPKNESDTWWGTGLAFAADSSKAENCRNLTDMSFKYKLTSDFSDTDVCIQLVWKDTAGTEIAKMENVPIKLENGDVKTYSVKIPKEVADKLNAAKDVHFDWFFIHFVNQAGASFKPGNLIIDDIKFNAAEAGAAQTNTTSSNPKTADMSILPFALVALGSAGAFAGMNFKKKTK
jgi:hypothetical protein